MGCDLLNRVFHTRARINSLVYVVLVCLLQSPFLLCRLFRKHDVKDDNPGNSNGDDVDRGVASPRSLVRPTTDGPSESATPIMTSPADAESIDPAACHVWQTNNYNVDS